MEYVSEKKITRKMKLKEACRQAERHDAQVDGCECMAVVERAIDKRDAKR